MTSIISDSSNIIGPLNLIDHNEPNDVYKKKITCILCEKIFNFPNDKDDCLAHFYLIHRIVIADVDQVALLEDYIDYWRKRIAGKFYFYFF